MFEEQRRKCRNGVDAFLRKRLAWMPARTALGVMAWFGFLNLYMVRVNLSVAIVAMVKRNTSSGNDAACISQLQESETISLSNMSTQTSNRSVQDVDHGTSFPNSILQEEDEEGEMLWDETTQGLVLGSFFYGYALTQIIGGRLAELHGTKMVFGICIIAGGISAILSPVMARLHYGALITLRIIQGMLQGASWPSMHACMARWIPPIERPRFIAVVYLAATLSSAMTMPLCGVIIANHGWASQFYIMGVLSLLWCSVWFVFMYNSPEEHPRISAEELDFIQTALREGGTKKSASKRVPWKQMATSLPVWAILAHCVGNTWGVALLFSQLPTYMKNVLGFSIKANGGLSALPFICRYIGGILWSSIGSWLISRNHLSIRNTRRLFSLLSLGGPGTMILAVSFAGCDAKLTVALFCMALFFNGAATTSGFVNHTDIAPNFAGTLLGIENTLSSIIAFIVPTVTGVMTNGQQTLEAWQKVFWICVPIYFISEVFFWIYVSGDVQPWNDIDLVNEAASKGSKPSDIQDMGEEASSKAAT